MLKELFYFIRGAYYNEFAALNRPVVNVQDHNSYELFNVIITLFLYLFYLSVYLQIYLADLFVNNQQGPPLIILL